MKRPVGNHAAAGTGPRFTVTHRSEPDRTGAEATRGPGSERGRHNSALWPHRGGCPWVAQPEGCPGRWPSYTVLHQRFDLRPQPSCSTPSEPASRAAGAGRGLAGGRRAISRPWYAPHGAHLAGRGWRGGEAPRPLAAWTESGRGGAGRRSASRGMNFPGPQGRAASVDRPERGGAASRNADAAAGSGNRCRGPGAAVPATPYPYPGMALGRAGPGWAPPTRNGTLLALARAGPRGAGRGGALSALRPFRFNCGRFLSHSAARAAAHALKRE